MNLSLKQLFIAGQSRRVEVVSLPARLVGFLSAFLP